MKELREFVEMMDAIEAGKPIKEDAVDTVHLSDMLDELEEHLSQAVGIANDLARYGRDLPGPFSGQIRSYLAPHLESFIDDRRQPGSIASLRSILIDSQDEDDDLEEDFAARSPADSSSPLSHANQVDLVVKGNHNED